MTHLLQRIRQDQDGTFGQWHLPNGEKLFVTCEDPWNNNATGISCIPAGTYKVSKFSGQHFKDVWQVHDVPGRSAILMHAGNTIKDTKGCILCGQSFSTLDGLPSITHSKDTLDMLRETLPDEFQLEIRDVG